jgi:hypothetical protein
MRDGSGDRKREGRLIFYLYVFLGDRGSSPEQDAPSRQLFPLYSHLHRAVESYQYLLAQARESPEYLQGFASPAKTMTLGALTCEQGRGA